MLPNGLLDRNEHKRAVPPGDRHPGGDLGRRRGAGLDVPVLQRRPQGRVLQEQAQGRAGRHRSGHAALHARVDRALHGGQLARQALDAELPREQPARARGSRAARRPAHGVLHRARRGARGLPAHIRPRGPSRSATRRAGRATSSCTRSRCSRPCTRSAATARARSPSSS